MAFREKIAWLTLGTMVIAYGVYFTLLARTVRDGDPPLLTMLGLFAGVTIAQVIVIAIGAAIIAVMARRDADAPADERDRAIARRGANIAYFVLMTGAIVAGVVMPFYAPRWQIINTVLLAIVIAEGVRNILVISSYRRGWHG